MVCEKCWSDAGGDSTRYMELLRERENEKACTPAEQCGERHLRTEDMRTCRCGKVRAAGGAP